MNYVLLKLVIVGKRGNGNLGDIAVDDIQMEPGWCSSGKYVDKVCI